jgi:hypothetical protein
MTDKQLSDREIKALQIAAKSKLTQKGHVWLVPSQAGHGEYEVHPDRKRRDAHARILNLETLAANISSRLNMC